jgi:hypothetical protein
MKQKVRLTDKKLIKEFWAIISVFTAITSLLALVYEIPSKYKYKLAIIMFVIFIVIYLILWIRANLMSKITLHINNSILEIRFGDIFTEPQWKVICFNEYFDTRVDNNIISENSLNGRYIQEFISDIDDLDKRIALDKHLKQKIVGTNKERAQGKNIKYKLGTIFKNEKYLLTAFSRFDEDNRAIIDMQDYINFLLNFWNEVDIVYNSESVSIPLIGSGITRFKDYNINEQELLELIIWSFKISRVKFTYPSRVSIILHESARDKVNLYRLKGGGV